MRRLLFPAPVTFDLLEYERDVYIDETLKRSVLENHFGIVDLLPPNTAVPGSLRPLSVSVNPADSVTLNVTPGTAMFKSGEIIVIENEIVGIALADGSPNAKNVIFLRFDENETNNVLTRFDTLVPSTVSYLPDEDYVQILNLLDYNALPVEERDLTIPLAIVTPYTVAASGGGTTTAIAIDHSRRSFSFNRPWFTPVDIEHRSQLGSGVQTPRNPHALSLNDVSATAGLTIFNLLLDHGMIVAKEKNYAGVPGKLCEEVVPNAALELDALGTITGYINARFLRLSRFPYLVMRATDAATQTLDFAPVHIPSQNLVFFLNNDELIGQDIFLRYISISAAEPPTDASPTIFNIRQPESQEAAIASGNAINAFSTTSLSFEDAGPIPSEFLIYVDGSGDIRRYPETCFCIRRLDTLGVSLQELDIELPGPSRLKFGLTGAIPGPGLNISIEVTGVEVTSGATVTETVVFDSTWQDSSIPTCSENPNQFVYTANRYSEIINFAVVNRLNDGPLSRLIIYADADPIQTVDLSDILPVSEVVWTGLSMCSITDVRPINTDLKIPTLESIEAGARALAETTLEAYPTDPKFILGYWAEDFDRPKYIGTDVSDTTILSGLEPQDTIIKKTSRGISDGDVYISKPIAVRPHTSNPRSLRFIPIEPGASLEILVRYFDETSAAWSNWISVMLNPDFAIDLVAAGAGPLVKWQMRVTGKVRGMVVVYLTDGPGIPPSFVFDVGAFDEGVFG